MAATSYRGSEAMDDTRLGAWIADTLGVSDLVIEDSRALGGGSIQENRLIRCRTGQTVREFVLRRDAPATIASSRSGGRSSTC